MKRHFYPSIYRTAQEIPVTAKTPPRRFPRWRRCLAGGMLCLTLAAGSGVGAATPANGAGPVPVNGLANAGATTTVQNPGVVSWVHIGDLHITTADQQNYKDLQTIIANTNQYLKNGVNFAVLPGDNANDDTEAEYQLIKQATDQLQVPLYSVPGDHDLKSGLTNYNKYMEPVDYQSFTADKYHFVFLDVMSGISNDEKTWLTNDLDTAAKAGLKSVIVMHSYTVASQIQDVIQRDNVIMVDSGHTHYNDVANDGHTVYAAGRNTGQVTEGPVGFDMINLDNGVVSWKFKPLGSWPFAMITSPSDEQLMIDGTQVVHGVTDIRAKIWDDKGVASATMSIDNGTPIPMQQIGTTQMWSVPWDSTAAGDGEHRLTLNVTGAGGNTTEDKITVLANQSGTTQLSQRSFGPSGNSLGAYAEKGLLGNHAAGAGGKGAPGAAGGKGAPGGAACPPTANAATGTATATPSPSAAANTGTAPVASAASGSPAADSQITNKQPAANCAPAAAGSKGGKAAPGSAGGTQPGTTGTAPNMGTAPSAGAATGTPGTTVPPTGNGANPAAGTGTPNQPGAGGKGRGSKGMIPGTSAQPSAPAMPAAPGTSNPAPNGGAQPGQAPATGGKGAPGAKGHGAATVTAVNGNQVTVKYADGTTQTVTVAPNTQIIKEVTASTADLKPGETVAIGGVNGTGDGQIATTVEIPLPTTTSPAATNSATPTP